VITVSEAQLAAWLTPLLWPFLRVLALFSSLPVLGQRGVPVRVRVGLAFFIAVAAQASLPAMPAVALDSPAALAMVVQQVVIGLTMGFVVRLVFAGVELAGELIGLQMGLNFAGFFDPMSASAGTASARFLGTMTALVFVVINGHLFIIAALVQSFQVFPAAPDVLGFLNTLQPQAWASELFVLGLTLALPVVGMLLFVNLILGVISRVAPQINVFAIGFPVTLAVGMLGLAFTLPMRGAPVQGALEAMLARFV
jgi:flagellar biosynthesis protein FliR